MSSPECFGCGGFRPGGLAIGGQYLCRECEEQLVRSKAGLIDYQHWIDRCRTFWERIKIDLTDTEG